MASLGAVISTVLLLLLSVMSVTSVQASFPAGTYGRTMFLRGRSMTEAAAAVPPTVTIVSARAVGSGCPDSTPLITISGDKQAVTIPFRAFSVSVPASNIADKERACTITVNLDYPAGWAYVGTKWTYQGWVELDPRVKAFLYARYWYMGQPSSRHSCNSRTEFDGGVNGLPGDDFIVQDTCPNRSWSPCGRVRGFNALVRLAIDNRHNPTGSGAIKSEVADGEVIVYKLNLEWRRCP